MTSYHLSSSGPRACTAKKGNCPYAAASAGYEAHFVDKDEATAMYEKVMAYTYGAGSTVSKNQKPRILKSSQQKRTNKLRHLR
jgi:hypothetical protein